jgi:hypothetical protein
MNPRSLDMLRITLLEGEGRDIRERLDVLEAAWEKLIDIIRSLEASIYNAHERLTGVDANLITLRDELLAVQGKRAPGYDEAEQSVLDDIPEFDSVVEAERYAKKELAKGNRAETIRKWLDEPDKEI